MQICRRDTTLINNARFLILPWIECKGLASKIPSLAARQLPNDWLGSYGFRPVLLETFVEHERHKGIATRQPIGSMSAE
jgi:hypothetical protein